MKRTTILNFFVLGLVLILGATGCKKKPAGITYIPQGSQVGPNHDNTSRLLDGGKISDAFAPDENNRIPLADPSVIEFGKQNREKFAANTVYFDLDSAAVKSSEQSKLEEVANYFKSNPAGNVLIEGHCDERGTEGYNLTLGDRRANALREYLVNLGVSPERVHIVSFGEARPAVVGNDESAYAKNRRGEFIFIEPAQ